jgi:quercetin dioxygenase-like cupin family protein
LKLSIEPQFQDERGKIVDLLVNERIDAITYITFKPGAVRGNHFHRLTTQWTFVTKGRLTYACGDTGSEPATITISTGDLVVAHPNEAHAFEALEDAEILVFTRGPRAGFDYEKDTYRLEKPLIAAKRRG